MRQSLSKQPLFKKSGAKIFVNLDRGGGTAITPIYKSFFAAFSSEKAVLS
jgi:hypothetical protein